MLIGYSKDGPKIQWTRPAALRLYEAGNYKNN